ncbi:hypothetical protein, partial [Nocardia fluminea]|uniref:hypothetical protein n=1 Tax=Nocardia fluminea TaxID=134984 RepID=UPI00342EAB0C
MRTGLAARRATTARIRFAGTTFGARRTIGSSFPGARRAAAARGPTLGSRVAPLRGCLTAEAGAVVFATGRTGARRRNAVNSQLTARGAARQSGEVVWTAGCGGAG